MIMLGKADTVVAGGMENLSQASHAERNALYLQIRTATKRG